MAPTNVFHRALEDFRKTLRLLGRTSIDLDSFQQILTSAGFSADEASNVFQDWLKNCSSAVGHDLQEVQESDLVALYNSDVYSKSAGGAQSAGHHGQDVLDKLFREVDKDGSGNLDQSEVEALLEAMLEGEFREEILGSEAKLRAFIASMDANGDGQINREELQAALFRYKLDVPGTSNNFEIPSNFNVLALDPGHCSPEAFIDTLSKWCLSHYCWDHHLLENMATGSFGASTGPLLLKFLRAYSCFSQHFSELLSVLQAKLPQDDATLLAGNLEEEAGNYPEEDLDEFRKLGLNPDTLVGVPHPELNRRCLARLAQLVGGTDNPANDGPAPASIIAQVEESNPFAAAGEDLYAVFSRCVNAETSAQHGLGALCFASELVVGKFYTFVIQAFKQLPGVTTEDYAFHLLHVDVDEQHTKDLLDITAKHVRTKAQRTEVMEAAATILAARNDFFDNVTRMFHASSTKIEGALSPPPAADALYDGQSQNWVRKKANCLSDFTGRPVLFDLCAPHTQGGQVVDIGCGEGFCARKLLEMGAKCVVGMDISAGMIDRARELAGPNERYLVGSATELKSLLQRNPAAANVLPGANLELGCFDLAVAVFLFNYMTISEMRAAMAQAYDVLQPGGHFVFSVPHPAMLFLKGRGGSSADDKEAFSFGGSQAGQYFSLRDKSFEGIIRTLDNKPLKVRMMFKSIRDYLDTLRGVGFKMEDMVEAKVVPEHAALHPDFFASVNDLPLHLVFKVRKPEDNHQQHKTTSLDVMPRKLKWTEFEMRNASSFLVQRMPDAAQAQLALAVHLLVDAGIDAESFEWDHLSLIGLQVDRDLGELQRFGQSVTKRLLQELGASLVRGLNVDLYKFSGREDGSSSPRGGSLPVLRSYEDYAQRLKLAYYLLSSFVGQVDGAARGRLFDVRSSGIDATKADNVLFSVSNTEAGWHTDGASRDRVYDVVSLLCIEKATTGGEFRVANAVNALDNLKGKLPGFILQELFRPVPRDILENGKGKGTANAITALARSKDVLQARILNNSYPVFVERDDRMKFRYMRFWIETAHQKLDYEVPALLRAAMDALDRELDALTCFEECMLPGDMIYSNNMLVAHARNAFTDIPSEEKPNPRHKVRAWIQIQKALLMHENQEQVAQDGKILPQQPEQLVPETQLLKKEEDKEG